MLLNSSTNTFLFHCIDRKSLIENIKERKMVPVIEAVKARAFTTMF